MYMSPPQSIWWVVALPLFGFLFHAFLGKQLSKRVVGLIATLVVFVSFSFSVIILLDMLTKDPEHRRMFASLIPGHDNVPWIDIGSFKVYFRAIVDPLSILMCLIVTGVGGLIHLYATGYMAGDRDYPRFFTYLNLFIFFMLVLVVGDSILLTFVGWEGVGLCSYLLISFWFEDIENSKAGNKAFIVNRIGDVGFALGMMAIFYYFGTLNYYSGDHSGFLDMALQKATKTGEELGGPGGVATIIGILLFVGAMGKSAQFPLHVWLPDAMAGPTPVSALIHAATMVTAGVVMISRVSPIIVQSSFVMNTIASVGIFTAIFAATIALTQNDIKKVLAYSTVSQLGYMFIGCGVGAFSAAMFHVTTHAFFKALLFLGAGSVIHALSGEQDMRKMGGLFKKIPVTAWTMTIGWLAISGIFPLAGFWSKDEILGKASGYLPYGMLFYAVGVFTALLTAFYMTRLIMKTFFTNQRYNEAELGAHAHGGHGSTDPHALGQGGEEAAATEHAQPHAVHESPPSMWIPLAILAALSAVGGLIGIPDELSAGANKFEHFIEPALAPFAAHEGIDVKVGMGIGFMAGLLGIVIGYVLYAKHRVTGELIPETKKAVNPVYQGSANLWYVDGMFNSIFIRGGGTVAKISKFVDDWIVDGLVKFVVNLTGFFSEAFRQVQTGYVRNYALMMLFGVVAVLGGLFWGAHNLVTK